MYDIVFDCSINRNKRQTIATVDISFLRNIMQKVPDVYGNTIKVPAVEETFFTGQGATIRSLSDKDKPIIGMKLAIADALEQVAKQIKKDTWKEIKAASNGKSPYRGFSNEDLLGILVGIETEMLNREYKMVKKEELEIINSSTEEAEKIRELRSTLPVGQRSKARAILATEGE